MSFYLRACAIGDTELIRFEYSFDEVVLSSITVGNASCNDWFQMAGACARSETYDLKWTAGNVKMMIAASGDNVVFSTRSEDHIGDTTTIIPANRCVEAFAHAVIITRERLSS